MYLIVAIQKRMNQQQKSSPGYVYLEYGGGMFFSEKTRYKVQLPLDMDKRQVLNVLYNAYARVDLVYCNAKETRKKKCAKNN